SFVSETLVFSADIKTYTDYYAFGMEMVGRNWSESEAYRQGYNGKENDKDFGEGVQDYGMRVSDTQTCRFFSVDPLTQDYPWYTPYQFAGNMPIIAVDLDGAEPLLSFFARKIIKAGLKKATQDFIEEQIKNRMKAYVSKKIGKQLLKDADDIANSLHSSWWEFFVELIPIVGDIYDAVKIPQKVKEVYGKLESMSKIIDKIEKVTKKTQIDNIIKAANDIFVKINHKYSSKKINDLVESTAENVNKLGNITGEIITITKSRNRVDAFEIAKAETGFDPKTWKPNGKDGVINGWISPDETAKIYIDYDDTKGAHYNWSKNKVKGAILFEANADTVDGLKRKLSKTYNNKK
ncbi:MAG: hypothetical protein EAZ06_12115, partial [Cytophagales bacterium]